MIKRLLFTSVLLSSVAFANTTMDEVKSIDIKTQKCMELSSDSIGMRLCLSQQAEELDVILNKIYKTKREKMVEEQKKLLTVAQLDWLKYRESNCISKSTQALAGAEQVIIEASCHNAMTSDRIVELSLFITE